jgi:hypothetical protein
MLYNRTILGFTVLKAMPFILFALKFLAQQFLYIL